MPYDERVLLPETSLPLCSPHYCVCHDIVVLNLTSTLFPFSVGLRCVSVLKCSGICAKTCENSCIEKGICYMGKGTHFMMVLNNVVLLFEPQTSSSVQLWFLSMGLLSCLVIH